jgi:hypothetical protein
MSVLEPFNPRHAAAAIMKLASNGELPETMVSAILDVPLPRPDARYDDGKSLELKRMNRLERTFDELLRNHNIMGVNERGGIRLIPATQQVEVSHTRGLKRLDGVLRGMMQEARYIDASGFNNAQTAEARDYAAWLDALRRAMLPGARTLKHALPIDMRFDRQGSSPFKPRPRLAYSVEDDSR